MQEACRVCREQLATDAVTAGVGKYHTECFVCVECLRPFPDGQFMQSPDDNMLYCEQDYYKLFGDRCARCGDLITERCIDALDLKWHHDHFCCDSCGKSLAGGSFVKRGDRPFCKECSNKLKNTGMFS